MSKQQGYKILRPLWVRVLIVIFCFGWAFFEFHGNEITWAIIFVLMGVYGFWSLILTYDSGANNDGGKG